MLFRTVACLAALSVAACATTTETANTGAGVSYAATSLTNLSRIEIAQNYRFTESTLPDYDGGVLPASSSDKTDAHEDVAKLPERFGSRIDNLGAGNDGTVIFHRTQSATPEGWTDTGEAFSHLQSGLSCQKQINIDGENRQFILIRIDQYDDAGRDVSCSLASNNGDAEITVYASYWPDVTRDDHALSAAAAIYQRFNVSEQLPVPIVTLDAREGNEEISELIEGMEEPIAGGFAIGELNGVPYKTSLWVAKTFDWHVKVRATYPIEDITSEVVAAVYFSAAHLGVRAKNLAEPTAPGAEV